MSRGPLGNAEVRRELSPCSVQSIDKVFQEVFENSCLLSWDDIVNNLQGGLVSDIAITNSDCDAEGILIKIGTYLSDLKHYNESQRKRRVINTSFRKFKHLLRTLDENLAFEKIAVSFKVFFREVKALFKIFGEEMEIFLVRKINNLGKSLVKCISNKNN